MIPGTGHLVVPLTEAEFQRRVTTVAEELGWDWMHVGRVGKYAPNGAKGTLGIGWPDLLLVRGDRLFVCELKEQSAPPPSTDQKRVLSILGMAVPAYVFRPSDLPLIMEILQ